MPEVDADVRVAELVFLDALDLTPAGRLRLNAAFVAECRAAFEADPSSLDRVFQDALLARAAARGVVCTGLDELALTALEVAVEEGTRMEAAE